MVYNTPGFTVLHCFSEFARIHIHWIGDAIQPSHFLSSPFSPTFNLSQHQGLFQWLRVLCIRWPKYYNFSHSIHPSNEHSRLTSFRIHRFDLLAVQGALKSLSNTTVQKHQFFSAQPSLCYKSHIHTWLLEKNIALTIYIFVSKVTSLLFNTLSRFVIAFLPRSKHLLIPGLQLPSAVIL